jgi:arabinogalactan oligomer/maltooligosaccharide transport system permease protein
MVVALGGLQSIPNDLYEAAEVDGASRWQQFWYITLPMLKPVMVPAVILGMIWTFNNINVVWLVSNGGEPSDQTHILVSYVYKSAFNLYRYGYAAALSMVIFSILLVMGVLSIRQSKSTESVY